MSKKKIIILIIIVTILGAFVVCFKIKKGIISESDYLKVNCNIFNFFDIEKRGDVIWDKKDLCLIAQAENELNVKKCPKNIEFCIEFIAAKKKDYSICDYLEGYEGACIIGVAKEKVDTNKCLSYFENDKYNQYDCLNIVNIEKLRREAENWPIYNNKKYSVKYPNAAKIFDNEIISGSPGINSNPVIISIDDLVFEIRNLNLSGKESAMNFKQFMEYAINGSFEQNYNLKIGGEPTYQFKNVEFKIDSLGIDAESNKDNTILFEHNNDRYMVFVRSSNKLDETNERDVQYLVGESDDKIRERVFNQILNTFKFVD
jgi:hypothetical protein